MSKPQPPQPVTESLIALDAGTTGVTAVLYDSELKTLHRAYREFEQCFPQAGWVEHDARAILDAVDETLAEVLAQPAAENVAAIGITNQRETIFPLDPGAGESLYRGIVWQDRRTAERCAALRAEGRSEWIAERTGLLLDPYFSATKVEWMLDNHPNLRERCEGGGVVFATVDALIVQHLTEQDVCATDPTNASRTMLYNINERRWDPELCELFGLEPDWLPEVRPSAGDFGTTSKYLVGREIPIRGIAGDQQAALFGQGAVSAGQFKVTFGTGCFLLLNTGADRRSSERGFLTTLACDAAGAACFALEGSLFMAGAVIQWLRDGLGLIESASDSEALARSVESSEGVFLVPAFQGLGAPHWDADARGAILGLSRGSNRAHVVRAGLEGIALSCAELVELMRAETGFGLDELRVDGGAAANDLLMQMQADFAGARIWRPTDVESTARGAAMLAGIGAGRWGSAAEIPALEGSGFEASMDPAAREELLSAWRRAVERVRTS